MEVTVTLEARYQVTPDGAVWSNFGMAQKFWERYLEVFDGVRIVARARYVERVKDGWIPVTGNGIKFQPVPDFHGPWQYVKRSLEVKRAIRAAAPAQGAVILRVPSLIGNLLEGVLEQSGRPYALEVVGDPYEVFGPRVVDHPLRSFFRWHFSRSLKQQCRHAAAVAYVTKFALQKRYPTRGKAANISDVDLTDDAVRSAVFQTHYSNIELDSDFVVERHQACKRQGPYQLITVGSLAQRYKGTDVLIQAVAQCVRAGVDLSALIVGDGMYKQELMELTENLGMSSRIHFAGHLPAGRAVRDALDESDLFVMASRTEGLPRAMIEAMARGLPCIGTNVGGIPELLDASELVPVGNAGALAKKIIELLQDPQRIEALSHKNNEVSLQYRDSILSARRRQFYQNILNLTRRWEAQKNI